MAVARPCHARTDFHVHSRVHSRIQGVIKLGDFGLAKSFSHPAPATPSPTHPRLLPAQWPSPSISAAPGASYTPHPPVLELCGGGAGAPGANGQHADNTRGVGTALYAAPEQTVGGIVAGSADIFSLGIIMVELFSFSSFGSGMERVLVLSQAREGRLPADLTTQHPDISAHILACLQKDAELRPSANELLEHFTPMIQQMALPPLLELADRTIANLEAKVRDSDARESSLLAQVADLQARLTHAEEQLAERDRWLAQLRSRERGGGSTRPSTPSE